MSSAGPVRYDKYNPQAQIGLHVELVKQLRPPPQLTVPARPTPSPSCTGAGVFGLILRFLLHHSMRSASQTFRMLCLLGREGQPPRCSAQLLYHDSIHNAH